MTIEREAADIFIEFWKNPTLNGKFNVAPIEKALQAKQVRILELEEKVREYKWEWESSCERERATNERVKELESILEDISYKAKKAIGGGK